MWTRLPACCRAAAATATISTLNPMRKGVRCASVDRSNGSQPSGAEEGARTSPSSNSTKDSKRTAISLPLTFWLPFWRGLALPVSGVAVCVTQLDYLVTNAFSGRARFAAALGLFASLLDACVGVFESDDVPDKEVSVEKGTCSLGSRLDSSNVRWVSASMRGWRSSMEDTHIAATISSNGNDLGIFGVFDGHGGKEVASLVEVLLPQMLEARLASVSSTDDMDLSKALVDAVEEVDARILSGPLGVGRGLPLGWLHPFGSVGCTSCVAIVDSIERKVVVANTGDSRAILCRNGVAVALSDDHKPEDTAEFKRIQRAGGSVMRYGPCFRVDGGLNLSRALGDFRYKANASLPSHEQKIVARPDIIVEEWFPSSSDEFLVIACDGLFERMHRQQVVDHIREGLAKSRSPKEVLEGLLHECCARTPRDAGQDNETVILVQW